MPVRNGFDLLLIATLSFENGFVTCPHRGEIITEVPQQDRCHI